MNGGCRPKNSTISQASVETLISFRLGILAKQIDRQATRMLWDMYELKIAEWKVLAHVALTSPSTVRGLADRTKMDRGDVSRAANSLVKRSLLKKVPDAEDRRSVLLYITRRGVSMYDKVMPERVEINDRIGSVLTEEERRVFCEAAHKMSAFMAATVDVYPESIHMER